DVALRKTHGRQPASQNSVSSAVTFIAGSIRLDSPPTAAAQPVRAPAAVHIPTLGGEEEPPATRGERTAKRRTRTCRECDFCVTFDPQPSRPDRAGSKGPGPGVAVDPRQRSLAGREQRLRARPIL